MESADEGLLAGVCADVTSLGGMVIGDEKGMGRYEDTHLVF